MKKSIKNILIYVNSQYGIGHFERCYNILEYIEDNYKLLNIKPFLIYGGIDYQRFDQLKKVKKCQLSSLTFHSADNSISFLPVSPQKGVSVAQILDVRKGQIWEFVNGIEFSLLFIEYFPFSKQSLSSEVEFLIDLISNEKLKTVISIRDFMSMDEGFHREYAEAFLNRYCSKILSHSDPKVATLDSTYGDITSFHDKIIYTGYILNKYIKKFDNTNHFEKKIIVSAGGGRDGADVFNLFFQSFYSLPVGITSGFEIQCYPGQQMLPTEINLIKKNCEISSNYNIKIKDFSEYRNSLEGCLISISMCGYNTAIELLESTTPYVIFIPRNRTEQLLRAEAFSKLFSTYWTRSREILTDLLIRAIENRLPQKRPCSLRIEGVENTVQLIQSLIYE